MPTRDLFVAVALANYDATDHARMPKGWVGYNTASPGPDGTVGTSEVDLVTVAVEIPAGRMIKISGRGSITDTGSNAVGGNIFVEEGASDLGRIHRHPDGTPQSSIGGHVLVDGPSAGTHTYKLVGVCDTSGAFGFFGAVGILVEDIGPASS